MSNTTVAETTPRVHLSLFRLRQMWIELADQIDTDPEADAADDEAWLSQLGELEAEILAAPVEAGEDWAALVDLASRTEWQSRISAHLEAVSLRVLDQSQRRDRIDHARTQFLLERGMTRLRDEFGQGTVRLVIEAESAAEVVAVVRGAMASRNA